MIQSGDVLPSPVPFTFSLLVTEVIAQVAPHASLITGVTVMSLILWFGGHKQAGLTVKLVITGAVTSTVHVAVREVVDVLPQPSVAVHVLVCEREQLLLSTPPSVEVTVGVPQSSVAVAVPNAPSIVAVDGLHPNDKLLPVAVIVGDVTSTAHVAVRLVVEVLPQPSVAVQVLVCEREQPLLCTDPSLNVVVGVPHASVAEALPRAALIAAEFGLQPAFPLAGVPVAVRVGGVTSSVHVAVRQAVEVLPHPSVAVHVLFCERRHPLLCTAPSVEVTVGVPHASVAVAEPSAASIFAEVGLHPKLPFAGVPVAVIVGGVRSSVHVAVREVVEVLPQPSVAVNVLV
jgi:Ni,Fe-hydrogenase III small subunit